ncbi:unnamed protein product [Triticum turgidum subsp. durum]|uniref:Uncharacterized protein n=1 Tax=Triticum turgidum subsp. durum TaxID=4567 RepID=A0A9R0X0I9_TRITD|nr:unnamed protein product [Triticum turgidum subsp. durum]
MDLAPFKLDIDELLDDYAKVISFFCHAVSQGHMTSQSSLLQRLPGLYCLYCLYECQPYKPHYKIYLSLEESNKLKDFVIEAKQNGLSLVPALVKRMLDKGMFLFGFINLLGDNEAKEVDEMNASQNKRVKFACDKLFANTQIGSYTHKDLGVEFELDSIKKLSMDYAKAKESAFAEASQTVDVEDAKHILQNDKLLGDKVEEIVKEWDAQKEEFYQKIGVSPHDELAVVDNDESGEFHDENETDAFDELEQLLLE